MLSKKIASQAYRIQITKHTKIKDLKSKLSKELDKLFKFLNLYYFFLSGSGSLFRSSLQDSISSSIWVSENDTLQNNQQANKANDNDRPATANSLKTSNFDSDEA